MFNLLHPVFLNPTAEIGLTLTLLIISAPFLYYLSGFLFQIYQWIKEKYEFINHSSHVDRDLNTKAKIMEYDTSELSSRAISTGLNDYIFIPSALLNGQNALPKKELEALIAHEQSHINKNESLILFYVPLLSPLLFIGQNVIYGLLNFPEREHEADAYAAEEVSTEAVISALQSLQSLDKESQTERRDSQKNRSELTLGNRDEMKGSFTQKYYYLFFSTFAHSKSHPSIESRIERLGSRESLDDVDFDG
jgi:Zn-dependent protease with chaperone function